MNVPFDEGNWTRQSSLVEPRQISNFRIEDYRSVIMRLGNFLDTVKGLERPLTYEDVLEGDARAGESIARFLKDRNKNAFLERERAAMIFERKQHTAYKRTFYFGDDLGALLAGLHQVAEPREAERQAYI